MGWSTIYLLWFIINSLFAWLLASAIAFWSKAEFTGVFTVCFVNFNIIGSMTVTAGYGAKHLLRKKSPAIIISASNTASLTALIAGLFAVDLLWQYILGAEGSREITEGIRQLAVPVLVYTFAGTNISKLIEYITEKNYPLNTNPHVDSESINSSPAVISVSTDGRSATLPLSEILYISSSGKKTVIHTEKKDFEEPVLLKEMEAQLPADLFIRIHRQYLINISHLYKIQYYFGGRYMALLNDSDDSIVPVGRKFLPLLRDKTVMMSHVPE